MALGVAVLAELEAKAPGSSQRRVLIVEFTGDASYSSGGYAFVAATVGLTTIEAIVFGGAGITAAGEQVVPLWDKAANKIRFGESGADAGGLDEGVTAGSVTTGTKCTAIIVGW